MKAVIYARYSSDNQREENIEGQIRECTEYAVRNDITILSSYIDRALSARTADRPEFQRMIADSEKGLFDVMLVWKLDRFSRDRYDSAHYKHILKKNGVRVISARENISEGPEGIILESMLEGYAEYYSAELSEKINRVPQKYFNFHAQGDILSRITNDVSTLQQGLTNSLPMIISAATQFVGCLIMMFVTEWHLALVSVGVTLVGMLLVVLIMSKSQRFFSARQKSLGELNGYVEEMYSGHEVVRISRAGRKIGAQFDRLNSAVYRL